MVTHCILWGELQSITGKTVASKLLYSYKKIKINKKIQYGVLWGTAFSGATNIASYEALLQIF
jgi:hypothetical protein